MSEDKKQFIKSHRQSEKEKYPNMTTTEMTSHLSKLWDLQNDINSPLKTLRVKNNSPYCFIIFATDPNTQSKLASLNMTKRQVGKLWRSVISQ